LILVSIYFVSNLREPGKLTIAIMASHTIGNDVKVCELESPIEVTLNLAYAKGRCLLIGCDESLADTWVVQKEYLKQPLVSKRQEKKNIATISFTIECLKQSDLAESPYEQRQDASVSNETWNKTPTRLQSIAGMATGVVGVAEEVASIYGPWQPLADKIQIVVAIGAKIAEVIFHSISNGYTSHLYTNSSFIRMLSWRGV
jgi:hypothetical protein